MVYTRREEENRGRGGREYVRVKERLIKHKKKRNERFNIHKIK